MKREQSAAAAQLLKEWLQRQAFESSVKRIFNDMQVGG